MNVDTSFAWQEARAKRDEFVGGVAFPLRPRRVADGPGGAGA